MRWRAGRTCCWACSFTGSARRKPERVKKLSAAGVRESLGPDYDVDKHFTPRYNPWDQRMCLVPDGDIFRAIRKGRASVVTDEIESFTRAGLKLRGGEELPADIIVTATGLELQAFGDVELVVDGAPVELGKTDDLQGHDVLRRAQPRIGLRLHQRLVDAEGGPDLRIRLPPPQLHGQERARQMHAAAQGQGRARPSRGSIFPPAISSARSAACPNRARRRRGGCTRTTPAIS